MVQIDLSRNDLITDQAKHILKNAYLLPNEDYQDAFARAAVAFSGRDSELAQRIYDYASKQWFMFATPLLSNGGTKKGLPISCFLNSVEDSVEGILGTLTESAYLSVNGGGVGTYWGKVRSLGEVTAKGTETSGLMPFMHVQNAISLAFHQGSTRRGSTATYLDVSHPEIVSFVRMRIIEGGDKNRKNDNLHHGVCIPDAFMEAVERNEDWALVDPHTKEVKKIIAARYLWEDVILPARAETGEPYLFFVDTANADLPETQKAAGLRVTQSNLCTEITLPTGADRTAVCCLSSVNLSKYDEWSGIAEQFIFDLVTMLDNALDVFIENAPPALWRAVNSVRKERAIGLGTLGFGTALQNKGVAFGSEQSFALNEMYYSVIKTHALRASQRLAQLRGEPEDMQGTGRRHSHLLAIAPNATSATICGNVSQGIEPFMSNIISKKMRVGTMEIRNVALEKFLEGKGLNTEEVWKKIADDRGSIQKMDIFTPEEKEVFKTAYEIDQNILVDLAAQRQKYICQAQSLNLFFLPDETKKNFSDVHFRLFKKRLKSAYYVFSETRKKTEIGAKDAYVSDKMKKSTPKVSEVASCSIEEKSQCTACEG
jgi:ribonucleoside-diphosphate reductase alpha chain